MPKGPAVLREINEKRVLSYLRVNQRSSRQEIAEALELSKNTVSLIVEKFQKNGVLREVGIHANGVGRPRMKLEMVPDSYQAVGVFVQDTFCEVVVTDYVGSILESQYVAMNSRDADVAIQQIVHIYKELEHRYANILGLGVAVPGLIDSERGIVHYSSHLGWRNVPIVDRLRAHLSIEVRVLNRIKAAALSPMQIVPRDAESTFYVRIDEGVGGAFMIGNDIVHGHSRTAGEIGHLVVKSDGPMCTCGQRGCLEALVALPTVLKRLKDYGVRLTKEQQLSNLFDYLSETTSANSDIVRVMSETGRHVGTAIATIVNLLNPQYVVIDSPYNLLESFKTSALSTANQRALQYPFEKTETVFVQTSLSSAWGMGLSVIHNYETTTFST